MSYKIGQKIVDQKNRFVGIDDGPISSKNVGHVVDLCYVPTDEKPIVMKKIMGGAASRGSNENIIFFNDK